MRFRIKKKGLLYDKKQSFKANLREVSVRKSSLKSEDTIQVFFKGKKNSGIVEFKRDELINILNLSK